MPLDAEAEILTVVVVGRFNPAIVHPGWLAAEGLIAKALAEEAAKDVFETLVKLGKLKEKGVITEEEFEAQKKKLLGRI